MLHGLKHFLFNKLLLKGVKLDTIGRDAIIFEAQTWYEVQRFLDV